MPMLTMHDMQLVATTVDDRSRFVDGERKAPLAEQMGIVLFES